MGGTDFRRMRELLDVQIPGVGRRRIWDKDLYSGNE
jgi:hypothetical protein